MRKIAVAQNWFFICNTSLGKVGNIGFRLNYIISEVPEKDNLFIFSRRTNHHKNHNSNIYEFFSRFLNFVRIFLFRKFDSAYWDNKIFEFLCFLLFRRVVYGLSNTADAKRPLIYVTWYYKNEMRAYKNQNCRVIFDLPIASLSHALAISEESSGRYDLVIEQKKLKLEQEAFELADKIIVPSDFVKEGLEKFNKITPEKISVIPFGVDFEEFFVKRNRNFKTTGLKFLFTGAANLRKGLGVLLEAWDCDLFKDCELIICGRTFPQTLSQSAKIKNKSSISFVGFVDVGPYLRDSDVYVFPTFMEGSAKSVYEAMAAGLPIVTTKNAGSLIVNEKTGLLIPAGSVEELRVALQRLIKSPDLRYKLGKGAQMSVKPYSWEGYGKRVMSEIQKRN